MAIINQLHVHGNGETNHFSSNKDWHTRNFPDFFSKLMIFSKQDKQGKYKQFQTKAISNSFIL